MTTVATVRTGESRETMVNPQSFPSTADQRQGMEKATKRGRDVEGEYAAEGEEAHSPKRMKSQDILYRIVVPSAHIGKVIGKMGSRIQKIRQDTKATIKIADAVAYEERVIIISSKDNDDFLCDAQNALHQIANLIIKEDDVTEPLKVSLARPHASTVKLLIAGCQAGSLIGTSGQNIQKLRNSSGATIIVLEQHQLPLCASAHESDRVVQISGDISTVMKAVAEISCQLRANPPRQVITINPTYNVNRVSQHYADPTAADNVTFQMTVPESIIGGLIGRCGSNISRIRLESGATIKVHGGRGEQQVRQIDFSGTVQQVVLAKQRVEEYMYSQLMPQTSPTDYLAQMNVRTPAMAPAFATLPNAPAALHPGLPVQQPALYYGPQQYF